MNHLMILATVKDLVGAIITIVGLIMVCFAVWAVLGDQHNKQKWQKERI